MCMGVCIYIVYAACVHCAVFISCYVYAYTVLVYILIIMRINPFYSYIVLYTDAWPAACSCM